MNYKELLFNKDKVLSFYPELAVILNKYDKILAEEEYKNKNGTGKKRKAGTLGLNEAIIINQISYWNEINKKTGNNFKDGYYWTYNTYEKWAKNDFPYWSADTIRKSITSLENMEIIVSTDKYNSYKIDNTKWYRVDYDKLQKIIDIVDQSEKEHSSENERELPQVENESCGCVNASYTDGLGNLNKPIPETTTDTTNRNYNTDTTSNSLSNDKDTSNSTSNDVDNLNSPFLEMEKPVRKKDKPVKAEKEKTDRETPMPTRAGKIAYQIFEDKQIAANVSDFVDYFLQKRKEKTGQDHIPLLNKTIRRIVLAITDRIEVCYEGKDYCTICEPLISEWDDDSYKQIVDAYFEQKFKMKVDYSLPHFAQNNILTTLMLKVDKDHWCINEKLGFMED